MIRPAHLRCEYLVNPLGIDSPQPRLSWVLESEQRDQRQSAYQILVAPTLQELSTDHGSLWDTAKVMSDQSVHVVYSGQPLQSGMRCWWKVRAWDQDGQASEYSPPAFWQMGLLSASYWHGHWISFGAAQGSENGLQAGVYLRRSFYVEKPVQRATLYATAKGLYELYLNGRRVGDAVLAPGWTDYNRRIQYQTYDVTDLLVAGENVIGVILGPGWYCGYVGFQRGHSHYGRYPQFLTQLDMEHADGQQTELVTDEAWKAATSPILCSDLLMGETYDARLEMPGWQHRGYDDREWRWAQIEQSSDASLVADRAQPIRVTHQLSAHSIAQPAPSTYVFDMAQNMVGWARLRAQGEAGTRVRLRFAEVLNPDGSIHTDNLRSARATDTYILKGGEAEVFEPHFTFHGFRYVELTGYPGDPPLDAVVGRVIHSDLPESGSFECSSPSVSQLWRNILWSQRGNFVSIPTDCPQRDERLGWMGDAQVFVRTACLNMDAAGFFTKWILDIEDAQAETGSFSDVVPRIMVRKDGAPAWGDAGIIVPWTIFQTYGDRQIIERHYPAMARWMAYIHEANPHLLRTKRLGNNYGDWVSFDFGTSKELLATAYWAYDACLMSQMAQVIGQQDDAKHYRLLFEEIKRAFNTAYVFPDGRIEGDSQTAYALALHMNLVPEHLRSAAARHLVAEIERRDWHLSTGFVGTAYLCPVLTEAGYGDVAYRLLLNDTCPSWGHMVRHGATTIWERWNSWTEEKGLYEPDMNSFNHYAFGAVGEWLYRHVAGIDTDPQQPGFQHILIRPRIGCGLEYAGAEYQSVHGRIVSAWRVQDDAVCLDVTIPGNTTATVFVPAVAASTVTESGNPLEAAAGVRFLRQADDALVLAVGSGDYHFAVAPYAVAAADDRD